jgi:hypothetical protein
MNVNNIFKKMMEDTTIPFSSEIINLPNGKLKLSSLVMELAQLLLLMSPINCFPAFLMPSTC